MEDVEDDQPASKRVKYSSTEPKDISENNSSEVVGSKGVVKKVELVRLIVDALHTLGYENTGKFLEEESGIPLRSTEVNLFMQQIIEGKWDESVSTLKKITQTLEKITYNDISAIKSVAVLIYEQKFFEILERKDFMEASKTLRTEIEPICNRGRVRELSMYILHPSQDILNGQGLGLMKPRVELLDEIKDLLPPKVMVPKNRLVSVVEKGLDLQKRDCMFHNPLVEDLSLLSDHRCGREQIPCRTSQTLIQHSDEVLFLKFSHNGKYLASSSRDRVVIIWEVQEKRQLSVKHRLSGFKEPVLHISWSPDDLRFLTCGLKQYIALWDLLSGQLILEYGKVGLGMVSCGWHPNGNSIFISFTNNTVSRWNLRGDELKCWEGLIFTKNAYLEITRNKREIIIMCDENTIVFHAWESISSKYIIENEKIVSFSSSEDGKFLLVSLSNEKLHLYSTEGDHPMLVAKYKGHRRSRFVVRSCFGGLDEAFIASGSEDSQVYIWRRDSGDLISTLAGHGGVVNCVSWNPVNPHMLASASDDRTIRIWGT